MPNGYEEWLRYCSLIISGEVFFVSGGHRKPENSVCEANTASCATHKKSLCIAKRVGDYGVNSNVVAIYK